MFFALLFSWDILKVAIYTRQHSPARAYGWTCALRYAVASGCPAVAEGHSQGLGEVTRHVIPDFCHHVGQQHSQREFTPGMVETIPPHGGFFALPSCGQAFGCQTESAHRGLRYPEAFWSMGTASHTLVTEIKVAEELLSAGSWLSQAAPDR